MNVAAAWLLGVLAMLPAPGQAEELGRLFFSPAERAALDARRGADAAPGEPARAPLRVDGYVRRASGATTVWVNGVPRAAPAPREAAPGDQRPGDAGSVSIPARARERGTPVRVGATLDPSSGAQRDLLRDGSLAVRR